MDLRNIRLDDIRKKKITIGKVAENLRTCIGFDCADIFAEYPDAVPALTVISPKGVSYPAIVQRSGNSVLWEIRDSDLTAAGIGEIQLSFVQDEVIAKSYTGQIEVIRSIRSTGEAPDPITEWETEANAKLEEVAQALEDIPEAIDTALEAAKESGEFDGPPGQDGAPGRDGQDGAPGQDGTDGEDGVSPTVTVTDIPGGHHVVITDAAGEHPFDVMDGETQSIPVTDVQANGTSILDDGVAKIPLASTTTPGLIILGTGLYKDASSEKTVVDYGSSTQIKQGVSNIGIPISRQHISAFYALAKLAGVDLANETVTVGQYPDSAKVAIQKMLGIYEAPWELIRSDTFTNASEANHVITTDQYGEAFELTDAILYFTTPQQENVSGKGDYGRIRFWYGTGGYSYKDAYFNPYTQAANAEAKTGMSMVKQTKGLLEIISRLNTGRSNTTAQLSMGGNESSDISTPIQIVSPPLAFIKIEITAVTGTAKYWLYGKRKWN